MKTLAYTLVVGLIALILPGDRLLLINADEFCGIKRKKCGKNNLGGFGHRGIPGTTSCRQSCFNYPSIATHFFFECGGCGDFCFVTLGPLDVATGGARLFSFIDLPDAATDVTLTTSIRGDFEGPNEFAEILAEDSTLIGSTGNYNNGECNLDFTEDEFVISMEDFNAMNEDSSVNLLVDLSDEVESICNTKNGKVKAQINITLTYNGPGCPVIQDTRAY